MVLSNFIEALKDIRVERYAKFISLPNNDEPSWKFDVKCPVCNSWGFDTDNYCANCGAKFERKKENE